MAEDVTVIGLSDESSLMWYFGPGLSIYDRSTFGAILAKLDREGSGSEPCERCDGAGILEDGGFSIANKCRTCDGSGRAGRIFCHDCKGFGSVEPYRLSADHGGWCPQCRGTGTSPMETLAKARTPCRVCQQGRHQRAKPRPQCVNCLNCLGTAVEPITAKPIHGAAETVGVQADDSALARFAITSRRVGRVRDVSPALAAALGVYYGDIGQRWALTDRGRPFSLYHLTSAGRKLARWGEKGGKGADLDLTVQEHIGAQAALESSQPKRERAALLSAAAGQAAELYARVAKAWNQQATSKRERGAWTRLAGSINSLGKYPELAAAVAKHAKALP